MEINPYMNIGQLGGQGAATNAAPKPLTLQNILETLKDKAEQLAKGNYVLANSLGGGVPETAESSKPPNMDNAMGQLNEISHILDSAISSLLRASRIVG